MALLFICQVVLLPSQYKSNGQIQPWALKNQQPMQWAPIGKTKYNPVAGTRYKP